MRRIWPPTYDGVSVRLWAAIVSASFNLLLWAFVLFGSQTACYWLVPGSIPAFAITVIVWRGVEQSTIPIIGIITLITANFGFYYLMSWILINMFRPATNWWPEKRS